MTIGLILALSRGICLADSRVKNKQWSKFLTHDVWGKTLGILGTGKIGLEVINRAKAFDMNVIAYDLHPHNSAAKNIRFSYVSLDELLKTSDIITVHLPFTHKTMGLIGDREIKRMKKTVFLINTSRGGIIDESALIKALRSNRIAGAAIDVLTSIPPVQEDIYELNNLIITPHIAAYTYETLEAMNLAQAEEYRRIVRGELPINIVNKEVTRFRVTAP